ncbi:MAG TPA: SDR family oxidoreductase [Candidatus Limnocylindrales bacterium]|nr:SDR family oxidoreductase [Candidatus Limnocylindrales bacterium]
MKPTDLFDLTGRVAVVIGGTGVLGGAVCEGLAAAGASVAVLGRSAERGAARVASIAAAGGTAVAINVNATDLAAIRGAASEVERELGPLDILVNSVGVNSSTPFFEIQLEEWQHLLDANLTSAFLACQVFAKAMIDRGAGGSIVNISSASSGPPLSRVLTYSIAKAGINNLTQYLALELAPYRIRVNAVAPGFFPAEQNRKLLSEDRLKAIIGHTPARRLGQPEELVGTVVWLASEAASGFVTGAIVRVDGGFSAMTI